MLGRLTVSFNPRLSGGCLDTLPVVWLTLNPLWFFSDIYKETARSATVFGNLFIYVFAHVVKISDQAQGQVTRSRQVTSPQNKLICS